MLDTPRVGWPPSPFCLYSLCWVNNLARSGVRPSASISTSLPPTSLDPDRTLMLPLSYSAQWRVPGSETNAAHGVARSRAIALILLALLCAAGCRIRREPDTRGRGLGDGGAPRAKQSPVASAAPPASAAAKRKPPATPPTLEAEPVSAAPGVLVLAVAGPTPGRSEGVEATVSAVRGVTRHLLGGATPAVALARGMEFLERSSDVPVAVGAPQRGGSAPPECDVVLLDDAGNWGGVGAVSNLESPARLAAEVLQRGWGFVVDAGTGALAKELAMSEVDWSSPPFRKTASATPMGDSGEKPAAEPLEDALDAGPDASDTVNPTETPDSGVATGEIALARPFPRREGPGLDAGVPQAPDAGSGVMEPPPAHATHGDIADSDVVAAPALAAILLRDAGGRFFVVAEACGAEGAPPGQLTRLIEPGASLFVDDYGVVMVAADEPGPRTARLAERVYRRLGIVQLPQVAANWGLQQTASNAVVAIVSRHGSAVAARPGSTWARNDGAGESNSMEASTKTAQTLSASAASAPPGAVAALAGPQQPSAPPSPAAGQETTARPAPPSKPPPGQAPEPSRSGESRTIPGAVPSPASSGSATAKIPVASGGAPSAEPVPPAESPQRRTNRRDPSVATGGAP